MDKATEMAGLGVARVGVLLELLEDEEAQVRVELQLGDLLLEVEVAAPTLPSRPTSTTQTQAQVQNTQFCRD